MLLVIHDPIISPFFTPPRIGIHTIAHLKDTKSEWVKQTYRTSFFVRGLRLSPDMVKIVCRRRAVDLSMSVKRKL